MKNQYFGDVNDYLKYGLLRCFADAELRIGVCWMLTPDDGRSDGRKIDYLMKPHIWRKYDHRLFEALSKAVKSRTRHVRHAQKSAFLPNALFFDELVPDARSLREEWLTKALTSLAGAELLFFDPDNGIEVQSKPNGRTGACKYLYWDEIRRAWSLGHSLLIFQHFPRENHERYTSRLASQLREYVCEGEVISLVTSNVVYLLACQPKHRIRITSALNAIAKKWSGQIRAISTLI
jgi:hypothetical protein